MTGLPDGYELRVATPSDHEAIVAIATEVFEPKEGAAVRHLLEGGGGYGPGEWTVVTDPDGVVVSACTRFDHRLRFGTVEVPAAQIEFVATRPEARRLGLVRAQFDHHHARTDELGALVVIVTGIPYVYRRLGYGYACVDLPVRRVVDLPDPPAGWAVADATPEDAEVIAAQVDRGQDRYDVALRHGAEAWRWLVEGAPTWQERVRLVRRDAEGDGEVQGVARTQLRPGDGHAATWGWATTLDAARALLADAAAIAGDLKLYAGDRARDPWGVVVRAAGYHEPTTFEAVYARVPDPVRLLEALRPVLSARLQASALAAETGELAISLYDDGVVIAYDRGEVTEVRRDPDPELDPLDDDGTGVAPDAFPALVFGRFTTEELARRHDDVGYVDQRALMDVLFPRQDVDLEAPL